VLIFYFSHAINAKKLTASKATGTNFMRLMYEYKLKLVRFQ
jgi:hypothetical protein